MKNIRKIVAILAAVLMLCSVVPMSAFAAPGDVAVDINFDNGTSGFNSDSPISADNGYLTFDAKGADWANTYLYANNVKADTHYVVTFKAKADKVANMNFKINNAWAGDVFVETVEVTTEWQDYEFSMSDLALTGTALVMFTSGYVASSAPVYDIDDLKIVEVLDPELIGKVVNADFETGDATGWETHQSTAIDADAAHDGSFGAHLKGNGGWGGMLNQTFYVNPGKTYEISFWLKVNSNGVNIQFKDGNSSGTMLASQWCDANYAGEWKQVTYTAVPTTESIFINFCGGGNGVAEDIYVDSFTCMELKDPSFDGYITNGDFETGKTSPWDIYSGTSVTAEAAKTGDYGMKLTGGANWGGIANQDFTVEPGKTYVVRFDACVVNQGVNVQIKDGGNNVGGGYISAKEWTTYAYDFIPSATNANVNFCGSGTAGGDIVYLDNVMVYEKVEQSNDGYIVNGTFDTGVLAPWVNLWGSCPTAEVVVGGKDSTFALNVVSGQWMHVRQTGIAVEANTDYVITAWAKNAKNMSLLVKDGNDSADLKNVGVNANDEWTLFTVEFNSGDYTSIIFSLMGSAEEAYGVFDNIMMAKAHVCEFVGVVTEEPTCELPGTMTYSCTCGEGTYTEEIPAYHNGNMEYNAAKDAVDCATPGNIEHWYCPGCGENFADANAVNIINPWFISITVDCVRPEGVADCATWTCETCGTENYGAGEHDTGVPACQDGHCSKCDKDIAGYGCANYDTPVCEDGVCYYCGGFVAGLGHENGAWAPCQIGECSYGCGLTYPATADHVDEDADDYCDTCWNHLNHDVDPCVGGECSICWTYIEGAGHTYDDDYDADCNVCGNVREVPEKPDDEIVYGDADGDGEITLLDATLLQQYLNDYEVTLNELAADADGDGEITLLDATLLQQYLNDYDVTLGPNA